MRVTLCVTPTSGNGPWGMDRELLAGLGLLAPWKEEGTCFLPPPYLSFISFSLFSKTAPGKCGVGSFPSLCFFSSCLFGHPSEPLHTPTQIGPSWTSVRHVILEADEERMTQEPAV